MLDGCGTPPSVECQRHSLRVNRINDRLAPGLKSQQLIQQRPSSVACRKVKCANMRVRTILQHWSGPRWLHDITKIDLNGSITAESLQQPGIILLLAGGEMKNEDKRPGKARTCSLRSYGPASS